MRFAQLSIAALKREVKPKDATRSLRCWKVIYASNRLCKNGLTVILLPLICSGIAQLLFVIL